jgi:hypothetical protein
MHSRYLLELPIIFCILGMINQSCTPSIPVHAPAPTLSPIPTLFLIEKGITYYVSLTGSDSNPGTQTQPWRTIQKAASVAPANSSVIVLAGTYAEYVSIIRSSLTFQAQGVVIMRGFSITANDISVKGFSISNSSGGGSGVYAKGSNIVIEQNIINDVPGYGIEINATNSRVKGNIVTKGRNSGVWVSGQNNLIENNDISKIVQPTPNSVGGDANCFTFFGGGHTFRGNYCHDIYSDGVLVTDAHIDGFQTWNWVSVGGVGHDIVFEKNVMSYPINGKIWNMEEGAYNITIKNNVTISGLILLIIDGRNISFLNNTFIGTDNVSDGFHLSRTTISMYNNIFAHQRQRVIDNMSSSSTIVASNNCYIDYGVMLPANSGDVRSTNAFFVNESLGDYHLQSNSPCIDKGITLTSVLDDKDGISRPQGLGYDMGAFEFSWANTDSSLEKVVRSTYTAH